MAILTPVPGLGSPTERPIPAVVHESPLAEPFRVPSLHRLLTIIAVAGAIIWSWGGTGITIPALVDGLPGMADFISRLFPPDWTEVGDAVPPMIQTIQMAVIGTLLGVVIAVPLALFAASNVSPHPLVYQTIRVILNVGRTIPELVLALAFVAAVGLGTFPGTLALGVHSTFSLSKIFAESIEAINPRPVEAVVAAGASRLQTITFAMLPQALPTMTSYSLLYWEHNIRAATVLGLVGAGGIGFEIQRAMRLFQYNDLTTYVLMLIVVVTLLDRASALLRARIT